MNKYERMISLNSGLIIDDRAELPKGTKGYYTNECGCDMILIDKRVTKHDDKLCTFTEELGHYFTTVGDITDQSKVENRKQEFKARRWAYERLVGIIDLIRASKEGIRNRHELAEYLGVTEEFLQDSLDYYKQKYGLFYEIDNYLVCFEPLGVIEKIF